jgi:hypothetical protein
MSAGAKLTVTFLGGKSNSEFFIATVTLSRDSLTLSVRKRATIEKNSHSGRNMLYVSTISDSIPR